MATTYKPFSPQLLPTSGSGQSEPEVGEKQNKQALIVAQKVKVGMSKV